MLEILPFIVVVVMRYHYHDEVPWWVWTLAIICLFSNPVLKLKKEDDDA